jgi:hypothetical protein
MALRRWLGGRPCRIWTNVEPIFRAATQVTAGDWPRHRA